MKCERCGISQAVVVCHYDGAGKNDFYFCGDCRVEVGDYPDYTRPIDEKQEMLL